MAFKAKHEALENVKRHEMQREESFRKLEMLKQKEDATTKRLSKCLRESIEEKVERARKS